MAWSKDDFLAYGEHALSDLERINELKAECLKHFDSVDEFITAYIKFKLGAINGKRALSIRLTELSFNNYAVRRSEIESLERFLEKLER